MSVSVMSSSRYWGIVIYKKYTFDHLDDQNNFLMYRSGLSPLVPGWELPKTLGIPSGINVNVSLVMLTKGLSDPV